MNIYEDLPKNWKDLQIKVAELLTVVGYKCDVEKDIQTVRETINIDVFAANYKEIPTSVILCECKYWDTAVPKTVIHSFRTAVSDFGANHGLIISKKGFQSGSYEAIKNTNILLFDWIEFQKYFLYKWIVGQTLKTSVETKALYDYVNVGFLVFFKQELSNLNDKELAEYHSLSNEYFHYAFHGSNLEYKNLNTNEFDIDFFNALFDQAEKVFGVKFKSYCEYYEFIVEKSMEGIEKLDKLFKQKLRRQ